MPARLLALAACAIAWLAWPAAPASARGACASARATRHARACPGSVHPTRAAGKAVHRHRKSSSKSKGRRKLPHAAKAHASKPISLPATCQDATMPVRGVEGAYECADGEPACANGAEPVAAGAGPPLCPAAPPLVAVTPSGEGGCEEAGAPATSGASYSCEGGSDRECEEDGSSSEFDEEEPALLCPVAPESAPETLGVEEEDGQAGDDASAARRSRVASAS
jgi:hypothetical protein